MMSDIQVFRKNTLWVATAKKAKAAQELRKKYEEEEQFHLEHLKKLSNNQAARGGNYVFNFVMRKGNIDYKAIPELKGLDLEPFRKEQIRVWHLWKLSQNKD